MPTRPCRPRAAPTPVPSRWRARAPPTWCDRPRRWGRLARMARERDLFANFERMRREMDELFGDVFGSVGLTSRRTGFSPAVDVFYADDPPRAIVHAELAGIDAGDLGLEIQGRELTLTGHRREADAEGRVYQQVEIEHGPFRRTIALGAEVVAEQARATYQDGILRVELPLADPDSRTRSVPIERGGDRDIAPRSAPQPQPPRLP